MISWSSLLLAAWLTAGTAESATGPLDLPALWQLAEQHNPELAAFRRDVEAADGRAWQARLYPNPTLELSAEEAPLDEFGLSESKNTVGISQTLERPSKRASRIAAASAERSVALLAYEERCQGLRSQLAEVYIEALYLEAARRLYGEFEQQLEEPLRTSRERVAMQAAPRWEEDRTRLLLAQLRLEASSLPGEEEAAGARLRRLLGASFVSLADTTGPLRHAFPPLGEPHLSAYILARHPSLLRADAEITAARRRLAAAQAESRPDLSARLAFGRSTAEGENIVEGGLSIPLPLWNRNQGAVAEARALVAKAEATRDAERNRVAEETSVLLAQYHSAAARLVAAREEVSSLADTVEELTRAGYRVGKQSYLEWLDARRTGIEARRAELSLLREANLAAARLWALAGAPIDDFAFKGE